MLMTLYHGVMSHTLLPLRIIILIVFGIIAAVVWFPTITFSSMDTANLTVSFLDVGQGDAIHIKTPDGYELLIDGGPSAAVLRELTIDRSFFDRKIDMVIATHPDTDHIAGLVDVLERYQVDWIIETAAEGNSPAATAFEKAAFAERAQIVNAEAGQVFQLGASTTVRILSPHGDTTNWESNNASVIVQVKYGDIEFMLTGDAPTSIEEYMVGEYGNTLESEVLKLGHHGSKTSSSNSFLDAASPKYAVVSAGKDNRYGHPYQDVVNRVEEREIQIMSTVDSGTVTFETDGKEVWVQ